MAARKTQTTLTAKQFQAVAKAVADPRRMALLESIGSEREYSCQKLCSEAGVTKGTVSHHVRELLKSGLIRADFTIRRRILGERSAMPT